MNWRRMFYTGLVNVAIGICLGLVLAKIAASPYTSRAYRNLPRLYMAIGGVGGFVTGWSWEGLRQLQAKRDREEQQLLLTEQLLAERSESSDSPS